MLGAPAQAQAPAPVLLVVGDSISAGYGLAKGQGWVDLLAARLRETGHRERVVNASISGDTTAGGRVRLPVLLREQRPHPPLHLAQREGPQPQRILGRDARHPRPPNRAGPAGPRSPQSATVVLP
jgi:hypothetical protein